MIPTKLDVLSAARGLLNIKTMFGEILGNSDKTNWLTSEDKNFFDCANKEFQQLNTNVKNEESLEVFKDFCKMSIDTNLSSHHDFSISQQVPKLRCHLANKNLFIFEIEELWKSGSDEPGIFFVHNFLHDRDLAEFEKFKKTSNFNHMSKFYQFEDVEDHEDGEFFSILSYFSIVSIMKDVNLSCLRYHKTQ